MDLNFSRRASGYFELAGFKLPREVAVHPDVPCDHPAFSLLQRFGGIHIGADSEKEVLEELRNDIAFEYVSAYGGIIDPWEKLLNTRLIGVAEIHVRHGILYLADDQSFFMHGGMTDAMGFSGLGFLSAVDNLLFAQSAPMIRPDQQSVTWYGIKYEHGHDRLYRYDGQ